MHHTFFEKNNNKKEFITFSCELLKKCLRIRNKYDFQRVSFAQKSVILRD